jgi:hypothetical protein
LIAQRLKLAGFADIPVLAEFTRQIAASRAKGKHRCTGQKVIEGLFFDGIDAITTGATISAEDDLAIGTDSDKAHTPLSFL